MEPSEFDQSALEDLAWRVAEYSDGGDDLEMEAQKVQDALKALWRFGRETAEARGRGYNLCLVVAPHGLINVYVRASDPPEGV